MYKLDLQSRTPIYQQIKGQITEMILLGVLQEGDPLPSVRSLARDLGINPNTAAKAYQELEREGILCSVSGKGSFVAGTRKLSEQLRRESLEELGEAMKKARKSGISKEDLLRLAEEIYGTGGVQ